MVKGTLYHSADLPLPPSEDISAALSRPAEADLQIPTGP